MDEYIRGYYHLSEAWYGPANLQRNSRIIDEVTFGILATEGGTTGEMSIKWVQLGSGKPSPKLECFDDAWRVLSEFSDVIQEMAKVDDKQISPKDFCKLLDRCGFTDATPRQNPYAEVADGPPERREAMLENALVSVLDALAEDNDNQLHTKIANARKLVDTTVK